MLAAKHFDPVLGIDIHLIQPPGPVPPVPIPHPFVGFLMDPADYVPIVGSTVQINGMHRAQAGTAGKCVPPHIPIGGVFVPPPPGNECEMFMGSATVEIDGDAQSYMSLPALSCQSIGMPSIPRISPKKKTIPKCLMLPTSLVLPIPAGPPVMIGGPPTISIMGLAMKAGMAALGKLAKAFKKLQKGSKRWKALSDKLRAAARKAMDKLGIPPSLQNKVSRAICAVTGHPVDIATGKVFTEAVDFELPGPLPLRWERVWFSTSTYQGSLGYGWHHSYDLGLVDEGDAIVVRMADGRAVTFPPLEVGGSAFDRMERMTLLRNSDGYVMRDIGGLNYRFCVVTFDSPVQKLLAVSDRSGFRIEFRYDKYGHLEELTDSAGRRLTVTTDSKDRIVEIHGPHPDEAGQSIRLVSYEYDIASRLTVVRDALDQPMWFEYNHAGLLARETNRNGLSFCFEYDANDTTARCIHTWGDGGIYNHHLEYDLELRRTRVTNSLGQTTTHFWNADGLVLMTIDPLGGTKSTVFNEFNQPVEMTDELGLATTLAYDGRGNRIGVTTPDGAATSFIFDQYDLPIQATDAVGGQWKWVHDEYGRITQRTDATGRSIQLRYSSGRVSSIIDPGGGETLVTYDVHGNLESVTLPNGSRNTWKHDFLGRLVHCTDPLGNTVFRSYDDLNRVLRIVEADGNVRAIQYDAVGNITRIRDRLHDIEMTYTGLARLSARREGNVTVSFEYNTEEDLLAIRNAHGEVYRFELDERREVAREYSFGGLRRIFTRDAAGRAIRVERASGSVVRYEYDSGSQVTKTEYSDGVSHTFVYRPDGQLMEATNEFCKLTFERDEIGRITRECQNDFWVTTEYDVQGLRCGMTSCFGAAERIERDVVGRAARHRRLDAGEKESETWDILISRDQRGREISRELPGGVRSRWQRNLPGIPVHHSVEGRDGLTRTTSYEWDVASRLNRIVDSLSGTTSFAYDVVGNLLSSTHGDGSTELRMPDEVGNLFRASDRNDRKYGRTGELLEVRTAQGVSTYSYDEDGNLVMKETPDGVWEYLWNAAGMLVRVIRPDGRFVDFTYDAMGRRLSKKFAGRTTRWIWDKSEPIHEWVEGPPERQDSMLAVVGVASDQPRFAGVLTTATPATGPPTPEQNNNADDSPANLITWVFDPETFSLTAKFQNGRRYSVLSDYLGTPNAAYDETGTAVWSGEISIYGRMRNISGAGDFCPFRFAGQYEDAETGLCYNRHRYYDPDSGVYIGQDPIRILGGLRLYGYVEDPLTDTDPFGLGPGDSSALDRALGGAVGDQHQAHHLIPCQVWDNHQALLDAPGIQMERNAASNGLLMPSSTAVQGSNIGHVGSHPQYNALVDTRVSQISTNLSAGNITPAQAKQQLEDLQSDLRKKILAKDPSIPVGPSATNPCKLK